MIADLRLEKAPKEEETRKSIYLQGSLPGPYSLQTHEFSIIFLDDIF